MEKPEVITSKSDSGIQPPPFDIEQIIQTCRSGREHFKLALYQSGNNGSDVGSHPEDTNRDAEFMRFCEVEKRSFIDRYLPYPDDHLVTRYVRNLPIIAGSPETKVYVTRRWDDINAVAFPDGSIFLSDRLLTFCQFEEEIESCIYAHERQHVIGEHHREVFQEKGIFDLLGRKRIDEWEADLAPALEDSDDKHGVNPAGSKIFLERLAERERKDIGKDIVHGDTYTRLINIERMIRLIDIEALTDDCRRIPNEIVSALESQEDLWQTFEKTLEQRDWHKAHRLLHRMSAGEALRTLSLISSIVSDILMHTDKMSSIQCVEMQRNIQSLTIIVRKKLDEGLREITYECKDTDPTLFLDFLFANTSSCRMFEAGDGNMFAHKLVREEKFWTDVLPRIPRILDVLSARFQSSTISDFLHVIRQHWQESTISPETLYGQGLRLRNTFHEAFIAISDIHKFTAFDTFLAEKLLEFYPRETGMVESYFCKLKADGLVPNFQCILTRLSDHFGLSHDEEEHLVATENEYFGISFTRKDMERAERLNMCLYELVDKEVLKKLLNVESRGRFTWNGQTIQPLRISEENIAQGQPPFDYIGAASLFAEVEQGDFEHFLRVMEATSVLSQEMAHDLFVAFPKGLFQSARDIFLLYNPGDFHQALKIRLGRDLTNEEMIRWFEQLNKYHLLTSEYFLLLITGRVFEPSDIVKLFKIYGRLTLTVILRHVQKIPERSDYFKFLSFVYLEVFEGRLPFFQDETDLLDSKSLEADSSTLDDLALSIFRRYQFDMANPSHLDELLTASCFVTDPNLKLRLQKSVLENMRKVVSGKEQYESVLFHDRRVADYAALDPREQYIDEDIDDPERLRGFRKDIIHRVENLEGRDAIPLILTEQLSALMLRDPLRLLRCLLLTGRDETELLAYIAEIGMQTMISENYKDIFRNFDLHDEIGNNLSDFFPPLNFFLDALYNFDSESRFVLCHDLLIGGKNGILLHKPKRRQLLQWFFDEFIEEPSDPGEKSCYDAVKRNLNVVAENADPGSLYFLIFPLIVDRILQKPQSKRRPWTRVIDQASQKLMKKVHHMQDSYYAEEALADAAYKVKEYVGVVRRDRNDEVNEFIPETRQQFEKESKEKPFKLLKLVSPYLKGFETVRDRIPFVEFMKKLGTQLGAPGTRILQGSGIFFPMSRSLRDSLSDLYDDVKGQFSLSGFHTAEREWGEENDQQLESFGKRIGGGSMQTVYKVKVDGENAVLKVRNPNVAYRMREMCDTIENIFRASEELKHYLPLVRNVREWIELDIEGSKPEVIDFFEQQNNGFHVAGNPYTIQTSECLVRKRKTVAEKEVIGKNLRQWDELSKEHDMRAVVQTLAHNFLHQVHNGLVHANIHIGNVRVTDERDIVYLDKDFILELDDRDKAFLSSLGSATTDPSVFSLNLAEYLTGFPENARITRENLAMGLQRALESHGKNDVYSFTQSIVSTLLEEGVTFPVKPFLLTQNVLALDQMAGFAGFSGLQEAIMG